MITIIISITFEMKQNYSSQGLSEIMEESDRQDFENPRRELAKLNNLEFLNQYVHLDPFSSVGKEYQHLLEAPLNPHYQRFIHQQEVAQKTAKTQLESSMLEIDRARKGVLSKQQLKALAAKKIEESQAKERLSTSRKEKREHFYELLTTSRRFNSEKMEKSSYQNQSIERVESLTKLETPDSPIKDVSTQQTTEDLFLRLQKAGEERDLIKKKWYSWGQKASKLQKEALLQSWSKIHRFLKDLLEQAMSRLSQEVGSPEVFRQLRQDKSSLLSGKVSGSRKSGRVGSTRVGEGFGQQRRLIVRFGQWFNKLLLDQSNRWVMQDSCNLRIRNIWG